MGSPERMEMRDGPHGRSILMPGGAILREGEIGYAEAAEYCDVPSYDECGALETKPHTIHTIRYNHRSSQTAGSYEEALDLVRTAMLPGGDKLVQIEAGDGVYVYRDQEDADRDDTGARAFSVISEEEA